MEYFQRSVVLKLNSNFRWNSSSYKPPGKEPHSTHQLPTNCHQKHSPQKQWQVTGELQRWAKEVSALQWKPNVGRHKTAFVTLHSSSYLLKIMESKEQQAICRIRPLGPVSPIHFSGSQITGLSNNSYKSLTKIPNNFGAVDVQISSMRGHN